MGIDANRPLLNAIVIVFIGVLSLFLSFYVVHLFTGLNTFKECTIVIYLASATSLVCIVYVVIVAKIVSIFELLDRIETIVNERKYL